MEYFVKTSKPCGRGIEIQGSGLQGPDPGSRGGDPGSQGRDPGSLGFGFAWFLKRFFAVGLGSGSQKYERKAQNHKRKANKYKQ